MLARFPDRRRQATRCRHAPEEAPPDVYVERLNNHVALNRDYIAYCNAKVTRWVDGTPGAEAAVARSPRTAAVRAGGRLPRARASARTRPNCRPSNS